ncbi:MAG: phage integrase central domain-containing protein [Streptosporangiales bacterium]
MAAKRRFGRVRKLPSGRWQARYKGPDGIDRPALRTFPTKRDAEIWLTRTESDILDDAWLDPDLGQVIFGDYARSWIDERPGLRPKTLQLYSYLLRQHVNPAFEAKPIASIREPHVRRWRKQLLDAGTSEVTVAKAYRLLKAILTTAADDGMIRRNPCRIKGASQEKSPERPVLTIAQVYALAGAIGRSYSASVEATKANISLRKFTSHNRTTGYPLNRSNAGQRRARVSRETGLFQSVTSANVGRSGWALLSNG